MRKWSWSSFVLLALGGCDSAEPYLRDTKNLYVLVVFAVIFVIIIAFILSARGPEPKQQRMESARQERNWMQELAQRRSAYIMAQQVVVDHCLSLMTEKQKQDPELRRLRLKAQAAMAKVIKLQEEMLKGGVSEDKIGVLLEEEA